MLGGKKMLQFSVRVTDTVNFRQNSVRRLQVPDKMLKIFSSKFCMFGQNVRDKKIFWQFPDN